MRQVKRNRSRLSIALLACCALSAPLVFAQPRISDGGPTLNRTLDAARLSQQATFGATRAEIDRMARLGTIGWLNEQFAKPQVLHVDTVVAMQNTGLQGWEVMRPSLWKQLFEGDDQLRQRVAYALSQIMVISLRNNIILDNPCGPASFMDMLGTHAFGNFRDLLKDMTLHPAMGEYLDMRKSGKVTTATNPDGTSVSFYPNENYARELLQLFSVGTVKLNIDGSVVLDANNKPVPTYTEPVVQGFAKAFTGWYFAPDSRDTNAAHPQRWVWDFWPDPAVFPDEAVQRDIFCRRWRLPMQPWLNNRQQPGKWDVCDAQAAAGQTVNWQTCPKPDLPPPHDEGTKTLLNGVVVPAGQTPMQDIDSAIDNIFNHDNVPPFISRQLIQRLTNSDPSPYYIARVARTFVDNGSGVRGDMKAVIRAILLDEEARVDLPRVGKLKEPVVRWVQMHRAFNAKASGGYFRIWDLGNPEALNQSPLSAPSVFNFYSPTFNLPGAPVGTTITAPEFELATTNAVAGWADFSSWGTLKGFGYYFTGADTVYHIKPDHTQYIAWAQSDPAKMVDELAIVLMGGKISSNFRTAIIDSVNKLTIDANTPASERFYMALWLIANSPEFLIQK